VQLVGGLNISRYSRQPGSPVSTTR
jgi:hypothetical protein